MNKIGKIIGVFGLLLSIVPSFLLLTDTITFDGNKTMIFIGTILWFIGAPIALSTNGKRGGST